MSLKDDNGFELFESRSKYMDKGTAAIRLTRNSSAIYISQTIYSMLGSPEAVSVWINPEMKELKFHAEVRNMIGSGIMKVVKSGKCGHVINCAYLRDRIYAILPENARTHNVRISGKKESNSTVLFDLNDIEETYQRRGRK